MNRANTIAYIGVGSNIGTREDHLQDAVARLQAHEAIEVTRASSVCETEPWGKEDQAPFLNAVLEIHTSLDPQGLHAALTSIEETMGREQTVQWGPRRIDLDLLLFGTEVVREEHLSVPHPRMRRRRFVLVPLAEIAPDVRHPEVGSTMADLLATCADMGRVWKHSWEIPGVPGIADQGDG